MKIILPLILFSVSTFANSPVVKDTVFYTRAQIDSELPIFLKKKTTEKAKLQILKQCTEEFSADECRKNLVYKVVDTQSSDGECGAAPICKRFEVMMLGELSSRPLVRNVLTKREIKGSYSCTSQYYGQTTGKTYVTLRASYQIKRTFKAIENPSFVKRDARAMDIISHEDYISLQIYGQRFDSHGGGLVPAPVMIKDDGKSDVPGSEWENESTFESRSSYGLHRSFIEEVPDLSYVDESCRKQGELMEAHIRRMEEKYNYQEMPGDLKDILSPFANY